MRENFIVLVSERKLLVFLFLVVTFSAFGPFGTYQALPLWSRVVFWAVIMSAIGFFMHVAVSISLAAPTLAPIPRWLRIGMGAMLAAIPGAAAVIFVFRVMIAPTMGAGSFPLLWFQVASIGWLACLYEFREETTDEEETLVQTRFHKRLPDGQTQDIISISMNDHYAEVTTTSGKHLVLIRMADALGELDGLAGFRIHRSHWVARKHLKDVVVRNKKSIAVLSDGRELPISKSHRDHVRSHYSEA